MTPATRTLVVELLTDYIRIAARRLFGAPVPKELSDAYEATQKRLALSPAPPAAGEPATRMVPEPPPLPPGFCCGC